MLACWTSDTSSNGCRNTFARYVTFRQLLGRIMILTPRQFGGDPDHVVIHGVSAGAGSVALHLTAYGGRNDHLFVGAISQSVFFPAQPYVSELEYQFDRTVRGMGCSDSGDKMACLRNKDAAALQAANSASPFPGRHGWPLFYWTPCVDGDLIRDLPYLMWGNGSFIKVPVVFGTTTDGESGYSCCSPVGTQLMEKLRGQRLCRKCRVAGPVQVLDARPISRPS
jgi:carboxylesterase type B